jgi:hypothetical protein
VGYIFSILLVLALFTGIFAYQKNDLNRFAVQSQAMQTNNDGQRFITYAGAVQAYLVSHPTFTGAVTPAMLSAQGNQFSSNFLSLVGNAITSSGSGKVITCYGNLNAASMATAGLITQGDVSIGVAGASNTWTSLSPGANTSSQPLATAVPSGYVVSVVQLWS